MAIATFVTSDSISTELNDESELKYRDFGIAFEKARDMLRAFSLFLILGLFSVAGFPNGNDTIDCNEPSASATAENSSQLEYFRQLVANQSVKFEDLVKLWYPERKGSKEETYFFKCQENPWRGLSPKGEQTEKSGLWLKPECTPDVLYSWGPVAKLENIKKAAPDGAKWIGNMNPREGNGYVFATLSPVSTYGYGLVPIRIKLKAGTKIKVLKSYKSEEKAVSYFDWGGNDFYILNSSEIESWSFATPEHYDEIVRDIKNFVDGDRGISYSTRLLPIGNGYDRIFTLPGYDSKPTGEVYIRNALLHMAKMILNGEGRIHYQRGSCRNRQRAFETNKPTYFNPFKTSDSPATEKPNPPEETKSNFPSHWNDLSP